VVDPHEFPFHTAAKNFPDDVLSRRIISSLAGSLARLIHSHEVVAPKPTVDVPAVQTLPFHILYIASFAPLHETAIPSPESVSHATSIPLASEFERLFVVSVTFPHDPPEYTWKFVSLSAPTVPRRYSPPTPDDFRLTHFVCELID
jgi:hypothetical protein